MIEDLLIGLGLNCGTSKNFNTKIVEAVRRDALQMWYFKTPIRNKDNSSGYMEAQINLFFPVLAVASDISESVAITRLSDIQKEVTPQLIAMLKKFVNIPAATHTVVPFWSNNLNERDERKDFANVRVHLIHLSLTVKYRESWFNCEC
jgi:hypothetical protein